MNDRSLALAALVAIAGAGVAAPSQAQSDAASMLRCRALVEAEARLRCYDAIPLPPAGRAAATNNVGTSTAGVSPSPARQTPEQFGVEYKAVDTRLETIESLITGPFLGWEPRGRIILANGQVWQVVDDSRGVMELSNPKVTVRRGALGAFYLEIAGTNRSPKVKRVD